MILWGDGRHMAICGAHVVVSRTFDNIDERFRSASIVGKIALRYKYYFNSKVKFELDLKLIVSE